MGKTWSKHFVFCITTYVYLYLDVKMPVYFERVVFSTLKRMITGKIPSIYIDVKKLQLFLFIEKIHKVCLATVSVLALYISFFCRFIVIRYFDHDIVMIGDVREEISISQ